MGAIEKAKVLLGLKPPVTPLPVDTRPVYTTIKPASGVGREKLLDECRQILGQKEITPEDFNNFTANMVNLTGGTEYNTKHPGGDSITLRSHYIQESDTENVVWVTRENWLSAKLDYGEIVIQPRWTILPEEEYINRWDESEDSAKVEILKYGYTGFTDRVSHKPVPVLMPQFPPHFRIPTLKFEMLEEPVPLMQRTDSRFPMIIGNKDVLTVCRRTLLAFEQ